MKKNILISILTVMIVVWLFWIYYIVNDHKFKILKYKEKLNFLENMVESERSDWSTYQHELYQCKKINWELDVSNKKDIIIDSEIVYYSTQNNICEKWWKLWKNKTYWFQFCLPNEWNWVHSGYWFYTEILHDNTDGVWNTKIINQEIKTGEDDNVLYIQDTKFWWSWLENKKIVSKNEVSIVEDWFDVIQNYVWSDLTLKTKSHEIIFMFNKNNDLHQKIINTIELLK